MTIDERAIEAAMLIQVLEEEQQSIAALRKLLLNGTITVEEHTTIFARLQESVRITAAQLAEL